MSGTLTATGAAAGVQPRINEKNLIPVSFQYNSGAASIDVSATTIFLCKIPHGATITDFVESHSCGSATCPADFGLAAATGSGFTTSLSAFASAAAQGNATRATKGGGIGSTTGIPYKLSLSDDAVTRYVYFAGTYTPSSATASLIINGTVYYTMDP
jgi:hypothetical protein